MPRQVPLTALQRVFLQFHSVAPDHFNMSHLYLLPPHIDVEMIREAVNAVFGTEEAFQLRAHLVRGEWSQCVETSGSSVPFDHVEVKTNPDEERGIIEEIAQEAQTSLNLADGPTGRVMLIESSEQQRRLLFVFHHLMVDNLSYGMLLDDFAAALIDLTKGRSIRRREKSVSFSHATKFLQACADSDRILHELQYWLNCPWESIGHVPLDYPHGRNDCGSATTFKLELSFDETKRLMHLVRALRCSVYEILISALARCIGEWTNSDAVLIDNLYHGRGGVLSEIDVSRTVGFFLVFVPQILRLHTSACARDTIEDVTTQLRMIPNKGVGYRLLRHCRTNSRAVSELQRKWHQTNADVSINMVVGRQPRTKAVGPDRDLELKSASESVDTLVSPRATRQHIVELRAIFSNGKVQIRLIYSRNLHKSSTIEQLGASFRKAVSALLECL